MTIATNQRIDAKDVISAITNAKEEILTMLNSVYRVGDIKASLIQLNPHGSWLYCNGQAVSRTTYHELYDLIGVSFGPGNGSTTFNVPDYRGKFLRGIGGDAAGYLSVTQEEGLPNIKGEFTQEDLGSLGRNLRPPYFKGKYAFKQTKANGVSTGYGTWDSSRYSTEYCPTVIFNASDYNAIYGKSEHVTPINQAVLFYIKAKSESY